MHNTGEKSAWVKRTEINFFLLECEKKWKKETQFPLLHVRQSEGPLKPALSPSQGHLQIQGQHSRAATSPLKLPHPFQGGKC